MLLTSGCSAASNWQPGHHAVSTIVCSCIGSNVHDFFNFSYLIFKGSSKRSHAYSKTDFSYVLHLILRTLHPKGNIW